MVEARPAEESGVTDIKQVPLLKKKEAEVDNESTTETRASAAD